MAALRLQSRGEGSHHHHHHMDPALLVFFTMQDLHTGMKLPIHFPDRNPSSMRFLPKEETDAIPFSSAELPRLLRLFSLAPTSARARAVQATLGACEAMPIEGEAKTCATSSESLHGFMGSVFGPRGKTTELRVLRTVHLSGDVGGVRNYTIMKVREVSPSVRREDAAVVACHTMAYPYAVVYCHSQESSQTRVFRVGLGENGGGGKVNAVAVCHLDTSRWNTDHVAFQMLGVAPGSAPVCHFFPADNFLVMPG